MVLVVYISPDVRSPLCCNYLSCAIVYLTGLCTIMIPPQAYNLSSRAIDHKRDECPLPDYNMLQRYIYTVRGGATQNATALRGVHRFSLVDTGTRHLISLVCTIVQVHSVFSTLAQSRVSSRYEELLDSSPQRIVYYRLVISSTSRFEGYEK